MSNHSYLSTNPTPLQQILQIQPAALTSFVPLPLSLKVSMKELRMDGLVGLGCVSQSSVPVIAKQNKRPEQPADDATAAPSPALPSGEDGGRQPIVKPRSVSFSRTALSLPRPNIAAGLQKLIRGFRSLSQLFLIVREEDDDREKEMVIGFPTDVQHVGHIGWDGLSGMAGDAMKGWEKAGALEFLPLPSSSSFSLQQFELAMAPAEAGTPRPQPGERIGVCPH